MNKFKKQLAEAFESLINSDRNKHEEKKANEAMRAFRKLLESENDSAVYGCLSKSQKMGRGERKEQEPTLNHVKAIFNAKNQYATLSVMGRRYITKAMLIELAGLPDNKVTYDYVGRRLNELLSREIQKGISLKFVLEEMTFVTTSALKRYAFFLDYAIEAEIKSIKKWWDRIDKVTEDFVTKINGQTD